MRANLVLRRLSLSVAATLLLAGALIGAAWGQPVMIQGSLSNFDVLQNSVQTADNFELDFFGPIIPGDFHGYYPGWGIAPRFAAINSMTGITGAEAMWLDRANPVPFGEWRHFGVNTNPALPPMQVKASWTRIIKLGQIPVPFQWWQIPTPGVVVDVLTLSPTYPNPVLIQREYALSPVVLPLEELQYDTTPVAWIPYDVLTLHPGAINTDLTIPMMPGAKGYLVRYTVTDPLIRAAPITRFVTQVATSLESPQLGLIYVNYDVVQPWPGLQYDNIELDFFGNWAMPSQILQWYGAAGGAAGIQPWGVPPLIRAFPPGMFPAMPDRGGVEVTWVDRFNPYLYNQMYHFGLVMDPAIMGQPLMQQWTWAQACWTNVEKYPVPVPWQFWQYGGDEVGPAEITRQYVSIPYTIPLEDLTWGYVGSLPWQPVPGDPIVMSPGQIAQIDVPVQVTDRAALVRYEVRTVGTIEPRARVINEALIDAAAAVQDGQERGSLFLAPPRPNPSTGSVEILRRSGLPHCCGCGRPPGGGAPRRPDGGRQPHAPLGWPDRRRRAGSLRCLFLLPDRGVADADAASRPGKIVQHPDAGISPTPGRIPDRGVRPGSLALQAMLPGTELTVHFCGRLSRQDARIRADALPGLLPRSAGLHQVGARKDGPVEVGPHEAGSGEVGSHEVGLLEDGLREFGP
jgi:hypothetical protein